MLDGKPAILTALHVVEGEVAKTQGLAISAGYGRRPYFFEGNVNIDRVADLAVVFLPHDFPHHDLAFWPSECLDRSMSKVPTDYLFLHGIPGRNTYPKIGDPRSGGTSGAGRDHWTHCLSVLLAGGGIRGGQTYGASDRLAEYPADHPVTPADVTATVYHAMGVRDLTARDKDGRVYNLLDDGTPIAKLF